MLGIQEGAMTSPEEVEFQRAAQLPLMWQIAGRQLIVAANLLREGHDAAKATVSFYASKMPILLLYGLAAENLVKGAVRIPPVDHVGEEVEVGV